MRSAALAKRNQTIVRLAKNQTYDKIAARYKITKQRVEQILKNEGATELRHDIKQGKKLRLDAAKQKQIEKRDAAIIKLGTKGWSRGRISFKVNASESLVGRILVANKIKPKHVIKAPQAKYDHKKIAKLRKQGWNWRDIATEVGATSHRACAINHYSWARRREEGRPTRRVA